MQEHNIGDLVYFDPTDEDLEFGDDRDIGIILKITSGESPYQVKWLLDERPSALVPFSSKRISEMKRDLGEYLNGIS